MDIRRSKFVQLLSMMIPPSIRAASLLGRHDLRIAIYHDISEHSSDLTRGLGITTPPKVFEKHLEVYARRYHVVDLETVLRGDLPPRALLITFDDAYRSVLDTAAPLLHQRKMPAVFFAVPSVIRASELMLDNLLCWLCNRHGVCSVERAITDNSLRIACNDVGSLIGGPVAQLPYARRMTLANHLLNFFDTNARKIIMEEAWPSLRCEDLPTLAEMGIEIANHTTHHVHCRCLHDGEVNLEIIQAKLELERWTGRSVRAFSFPYGHRADATPIVLDALRRSGHEAIFFAQGRANRISMSAQQTEYDRVNFTDEPPQRVFFDLEILPRLRSAAMPIVQFISR